MLVRAVRVKPNIPQAVAHRPLQAADATHDVGHRGIHEERTWRCPGAVEGRPREEEILVSRWVDHRNFGRCEEAMSPSERHVIGVALKTARLKFMRGPHTIFDGIMPAGTLHITGPSQLLTAELFTPCDFIHFHVLSDYLRERQDAAGVEPPRSSNLHDLIIRDPLAELLGRTLVESNNTRDERYVESVGQTLVMHIAGMDPSPPRTSALPRWRLKRVQAYIDAHFDKALRLADLAAVAGLSRMYFAGQFRAATGLRPHDYLLHQRIERAKSILSSTDMELAEVALTVGFQAQSHFSTVFKRFTGQSPARWRLAVRSERQWTAVLAREESGEPHQESCPCPARQLRPGDRVAPAHGGSKGPGRQRTSPHRG